MLLAAPNRLSLHGLGRLAAAYLGDQPDPTVTFDMGGGYLSPVYTTQETAAGTLVTPIGAGSPAAPVGTSMSVTATALPTTGTAKGISPTMILLIGGGALLLLMGMRR